MAVSTRRKVVGAYTPTYAFTSLKTGKVYEASSSYDSFYRVSLWTINEIQFDAARPDNRLLAWTGPALTTTNLLRQVPAAIEKLEAKA